MNSSREVRREKFEGSTERPVVREIELRSMLK